MKVNLSGISIGEKEKKYVNEVLDSGILSIGPYTRRFENMFEKYSGRKHAIAVSSGTAGLFLLLKTYDLSDEDEVITSPFSFVASANVIVHAGAHPVFCDIESDTLCISSRTLEDAISSQYDKKGKRLINRKSGRRLKGILAVDIFGNMPDYENIERLAEKHGLFLLEDSCESLGTVCRGRKSGTWGDGSVFAFYPNKQITSGEGGIVLVDSGKKAELIRALRNQGRKDMDLWLQHSYMGYNFRIDEMSAALGTAQMERLDEIISKRRMKADYYSARLSRISKVKVPYSSSDLSNGWFVYVISVPRSSRNKLMDHLIENGVAVRPYFSPIHTQPYYKKTYGYKSNDFPAAFKISETTIAIPFHTEIIKREQDFVINKIRSFFGE